MTIRSNRGAFARAHVCEGVLIALLAAPVLALRPSPGNVSMVIVFFVAIFGLGYVSDMPTTLRADDDGVVYLAGGRDRHFLAWSEIGQVVPRRFRGWPAEDAVVALGQDGRPLLVASVSMFRAGDVQRFLDAAGERTQVAPPVVLSPLTGRADGRRRPELAPERTSERFLASSVGGLLIAVVVGVAVLTFVGR